MIICPDCHKGQVQLDFGRCASCGYETESIQGMTGLLASRDRENPLFTDYVENYNCIAKDDLDKSIQDPRYMDIQTEKFLHYLPDREGLAICELGVGQGRLLHGLACRSPAKLVGIDIVSAYLQRLLESGVRFTPCLANAERLPFQEEFDLLVSTDVMEHVVNVGDYLSSVHRSLKPRGVFVVRVPYLEDIGRYTRSRGCKYEFVHLRNFSRSSLAVLLESAGFKIQRYHYDGYLPDRARRGLPFTGVITQACAMALKRLYGSEFEVARIPNALGRLLMRPIEIVAVCMKR